MKDPVYIHLQYINQLRVKFVQEVINAKISAEVTPIIILNNCPLIGDIYILDNRLRNTDTTEEIVYVGGWKAV